MAFLWAQSPRRIRPDELALSAAERQARRKALPIKQKESQRWIDMLRCGQELACEVPGTPPDAGRAPLTLRLEDGRGRWASRSCGQMERRSDCKPRRQGGKKREG